MEYESLSDKELTDLYKSGDKGAQEYLYEKYIYVVKEKANKYFLIGGDSDDLFQEGSIGLIKAFESYNNTSPLKNYVNLCVKSAIFTAIKKANSNKNKPLMNYVSTSDGDDGLLSDLAKFDNIFNPETGYIKNESESELKEKIIRALSGLENKILDLYLQGFSYSEISEKISKPVKSVDNAIQRIRKKIFAVISSAEGE